MGLSLPRHLPPCSQFLFPSGDTLNLLVARHDQPERLKPDSPKASEAAQNRPASPVRDTGARFPSSWDALW
jgi:hypothetical protein